MQIIENYSLFLTLAGDAAKTPEFFSLVKRENLCCRGICNAEKEKNCPYNSCGEVPNGDVVWLKGGNGECGDLIVTSASQVSEDFAEIIVVEDGDDPQEIYNAQIERVQKAVT